MAIREGDAGKAQASINRALSVAPSDASVLFEAGHVAQFAGDENAARDYWQRAAAQDRQGAVGKAAREALSLLPAPLAAKPN